MGATAIQFKVLCAPFPSSLVCNGKLPHHSAKPRFFPGTWDMTAWADSMGRLLYQLGLVPFQVPIPGVIHLEKLFPLLCLERDRRKEIAHGQIVIAEGADLKFLSEKPCPEFIQRTFVHQIIL